MSAHREQTGTREPVAFTAKEIQTLFAAMAGNHPESLAEYRMPAMRKLAQLQRGAAVLDALASLPSGDGERAELNLAHMLIARYPSPIPFEQSDGVIPSQPDVRVHGKEIRCSCGWSIRTMGDGAAEHRAHVAAVTAPAPPSGETGTSWNLRDAREAMCSEGGRSYVEKEVLVPFGYRMAPAGETGPPDRGKAVHAVARQLCFQKHGDSRYDPGNPKHAKWAERADFLVEAAWPFLVVAGETRDGRELREWTLAPPLGTNGTLLRVTQGPQLQHGEESVRVREIPSEGGA